MATTTRRRVGPYRVPAGPAGEDRVRSLTALPAAERRGRIGEPSQGSRDDRLSIARRYKRHLRGAITVPQVASVDEDARKVPPRREVREPTSRSFFGRHEGDDDGDE